MVRPPAVAGRFYAAEPAALIEQVDSFLKREAAAPRVRARGCVVPHAGYLYSGHVAGAVYDRIELPARFIILCPRHYPEGEALAINSVGAWKTPLGDAKVDSALAAEVKRRFHPLREDSVAHRNEHSLEVQLPFLQRLLPRFTFVPICLATHRLELTEEIGNAVADVVSSEREPVGILASSDLNHYEDQQETIRKDNLAISEVLALKPHELWRVVDQFDVSMCGFIPTTAMLVAAKRLGAGQARLLKHATSGDINGDYRRVVGYASIAIS